MATVARINRLSRCFAALVMKCTFLNKSRAQIINPSCDMLLGKNVVKQ